MLGSCVLSASGLLIPQNASGHVSHLVEFPKIICFCLLSHLSSNFARASRIADKCLHFIPHHIMYNHYFDKKADSYFDRDLFGEILVSKPKDEVTLILFKVRASMSIHNEKELWVAAQENSPGVLAWQVQVCKSSPEQG